MNRNPHVFRDSARRILWMSQHWLPRGGLHMQGFGFFRRAGREAFKMQCFFQVSNSEPSKSLKKHRKTASFGKSKGFLRGPSCWDIFEYTFRACFFFCEAKLGHSAGCHLWCWEPWILARCLPGFNGNYCLIWFFIMIDTVDVNMLFKSCIYV